MDVDGDVCVEVGGLALTSMPRNLTVPRVDIHSMLSFQRLGVYQRAMESLALVYEIVAEVPRGHAERCDQLVRAAESVVRNIAEGAGDGEATEGRRA